MLTAEFREETHNSRCALQCMKGSAKLVNPADPFFRCFCDFFSKHHKCTENLVFLDDLLGASHIVRPGKLLA